jgi:hypothetical protein
MRVGNGKRWLQVGPNGAKDVPIDGASGFVPLLAFCMDHSASGLQLAMKVVLGRVHGILADPWHTI